MRIYLEGPRQRPGSLAEFVQNIWWPRVSPTLKPRSVESYQSIYDNHIRAIEHELLVNLRLPVLQAWVNDLAIDRSPKTVATIFGQLAGILQLAHDTGHYPYRDWKLVKKPKVVIRQVVALTPEQVDKLIQCAPPHMQGPIYAAATLGLRRGEVCGLRAADVTIADPSVITLSRARHGRGQIGPLKAREEGEVRRIAVPRAIAERLLSYGPADGLLFRGPDGKPVGPDAITHAMPHICKAAKVPPVSFHDLRHACASNLRRAGVDRTIIQEIVGHTTERMTALYSHLRDDEQADAFEALAQTHGNKLSPRKKKTVTPKPDFEPKNGALDEN